MLIENKIFSDGICIKQRITVSLKKKMYTFFNSIPPFCHFIKTIKSTRFMIIYVYRLFLLKIKKYLSQMTNLKYIIQILTSRLLVIIYCKFF